MPLITAAESYFLQAEGVVTGNLPADNAEMLFNNGINAAFKYLYAKPDGTITGTPDADAAAYILNNNTQLLLADFSKAATKDQKIEAIIPRNI